MQLNTTLHFYNYSVRDMSFQGYFFVITAVGSYTVRWLRAQIFILFHVQQKAEGKIPKMCIFQLTTHMDDFVDDVVKYCASEAPFTSRFGPPSRVSVWHIKRIRRGNRANVYSFLWCRCSICRDTFFMVCQWVPVTGAQKVMRMGPNQSSIQAYHCLLRIPIQTTAFKSILEILLIECLEDVRAVEYIGAIKIIDIMGSMGSIQYLSRGIRKKRLLLFSLSALGIVSHK